MSEGHAEDVDEEGYLWIEWDAISDPNRSGPLVHCGEGIGSVTRQDGRWITTYTVRDHAGRECYTGSDLDHGCAKAMRIYTEWYFRDIERKQSRT